MTRPGSRLSSGSRLMGALLSLLVGVLGLAALWQPLKLVADSTECVGLSPLQSWAGLKLHVVAETVACRPGSFLQGDAYVPVVSLSLAVTMSALLVGIGVLASVIGGIATVRSALHRVGTWVRKTLAPILEVLAPQPQPQPIPVRVQARSIRRPHDPQSRRGPPSSAC